MTVRDVLLFSTENGDVYQCAFFGRLVLTFKGYWMVFDRDGFTRFLNQVVRLAACPFGRGMFSSKGLRLIGENEGTMLVLGHAEVEELVWLLESAHYMLSAQQPRMDASEERAPVEARVMGGPDKMAFERT